MARSLANGRSYSPWNKTIILPLWGMQASLLSVSIVLLGLGIGIEDTTVPRWVIINLIVASLVIIATGVEVTIFKWRDLQPKHFLFSNIIKVALWIIPFVNNILALVIRKGSGKWTYAIVGISLNSAIFITLITQLIYSLRISRRTKHHNYRHDSVTSEYKSTKSLPSIITTYHSHNNSISSQRSNNTTATTNTNRTSEMQPLYQDSTDITRAERVGSMILPEVLITSATPISPLPTTPERPRSLALSSHPTFSQSYYHSPQSQSDSQSPPRTPPTPPTTDETTLKRYESIASRMGPVYQWQNSNGRVLGEEELIHPVHRQSYVESIYDDRRSWIGADGYEEEDEVMWVDGVGRKRSKRDSGQRAEDYRSLIGNEERIRDEDDN